MNFLHSSISRLGTLRKDIRLPSQREDHCHRDDKSHVVHLTLHCYDRYIDRRSRSVATSEQTSRDVCPTLLREPPLLRDIMQQDAGLDEHSDAQTTLRANQRPVVL